MSSAPIPPAEAALPRRARRRAAVGITAVLVVVVACNADRLTGPSRLQPTERSNSSSGGQVNIPIPANNTVGFGSVANMSTGLSVPVATSFLVTVTGQTTVSNNPVVQQCVPNQPIAPTRSVGPAGDYYYQLKVSAGLRLPNGAEYGVGFLTRDGGNTLVSDTLWATTPIDVRVARSGVQGSINGQNCQTGLYLLSSGQTIAVEVLDGVELSLEPSSVVVRKGTPVSFTAKSRGAAVTTPSWEFVPASSTPANETSACGPNGANPCVVTVRNTGELRVARNLYGRWRSASSQLRVYTTFTLVADKSEVPPGTTVTFTPTLDGVEGVASRWVWRDTAGEAQLHPCTSINSGKCAYAPTASGTMWAYTNSNDSAAAPVTVQPPKLSLTASSTTVAPADTVTFSGLVTPDSSDYQVVGWSWASDGEPPILASSSPLNTPMLSPSATRSAARAASGQLSPKAATFDLIEPTDTIEVAPGDTIFAETDDEMSDPDPRSEPIACATATLVCRMAITKSGTITLAVNVGGTVQYRTAHVHVDYVCPDFFPTDLVIDVGVKVIQQANVRKFTWSGPVELGEHTVWIKGPWVKIQDAGFDKNGVPKGRYRPGAATNDMGNRTFADKSWAEFRCLTTIKDVDSSGNFVFSGKMLFNNRINIWWFAPPAP